MATFAPGFSTRRLSVSELQSPFQARLGVLLLSRQPSILVLLPCVDDIQYPCFSSLVQLPSWRHDSPRTSQPAVGSFCSLDSPLLLGMVFCLLLSVLFCLLLAMLFCHFVPLSEILVDLPLVVVQVLCICAPFRQYGFASFVDFFFITGSSGCDIVSVLCPLASPLLCGSLMLRGSPRAPPTPLLSLRHFVIIGSRWVLGPHSAVVNNNVVCCL